MSHTPQTGMPHLPYGVYIAKEYYNNVEAIQKFGYNTDVGTSFETIWDGSSVYTFPTTATTATLTSASGATDAGVEVYIEGVDANYTAQNEIVTLDASGTFTTTNTYLRIHRAYVAGSTACAGNITITVNALTVAIVKSDYQQTQMCVYTVPAGYTAYIVQVDASIEKQKEVVIKLQVKEENGVALTKAIIASFGAPLTRRFDLPMMVPEKSDIELHGKAGATTAIGAEIEIILEKN